MSLGTGNHEKDDLALGPKLANSTLTDATNMENGVHDGPRPLYGPYIHPHPKYVFAFALLSYTPLMSYPHIVPAWPRTAQSLRIFLVFQLHMRRPQDPIVRHDLLLGPAG